MGRTKRVESYMMLNLMLSLLALSLAVLALLPPPNVHP